MGTRNSHTLYMAQSDMLVGHTFSFVGVATWARVCNVIMDGVLVILSAIVGSEFFFTAPSALQHYVDM